jgi:hypothetical protein
MNSDPILQSQKSASSLLCWFCACLNAATRAPDCVFGVEHLPEICAETVMT